jgi:hypothetical protein
MRLVALLVSFLILTTPPSFADDDKPSHESRKKANAAHKKELRKNEVTLSSQVWGFSRIYPLLDGLLQDISATQVANMTLNPNSANGTSVDALQQSLQFQLQYSQLAGAQNAAAAQAANANSSYQTTLAQQETALMQQLSTAYGQVATAQNNLNSLNASGTASAADIATATQAVQGANANLTAVGNAITNFKNLAAPPAAPATTATLAQPTLPSLTSSAVPTGVATAATGTGTSGPSFPATKQMDNQINILWDRLARLVGAMSRSDSLDPDAKIFLVKFDTGIYPYEREKELLDVNYALSCGAVLDLFPRNAALNIVEDKYKDTSYGFGAVLSWFGIGGSVAYNREHLKASQLLGQSSYISGHGIGQKEFGWLFGKALGDDSIAPGPRNTFALVWTPKDCVPTITPISAHWVKPPKLKLDFPEPSIPTDAWPLLSPKITTTDPCSKQTCVTSIEFNRNEYDSTIGKPAPVTVRITLSRDMDALQTVSVNGQIVQRVRDNFGRAVSPTVSGTNGVLETTQMGSNTWIPTSPTVLLVTLDSTQFGYQFPQILLSSPQNVIDVVRDRSKDAITYVSGNKLFCDTPTCAIPSLGIAKSPIKNLGVARWISTSNKADKYIDELCITVLDPDTGSVTPSNNALGTATVQMISDTDTQTWGADSEVNWITDQNEIRRLRCYPRGSRLICTAPDRPENSGGRRPSIQLQVIDQHHSGGISVKGTVFTKECDNDDSGSDQSCRQPLIWKTNPPKLAANNTSDLSKANWKMWMEFVNVGDTDKVEIGTFPADTTNGKMFNCDRGIGQACVASFTITRDQINRVSDWMTVQLTDRAGKQLGSRAAITNVLTNIKPILSQITDDRKSFSGKNLVFEAIRVGNSNPMKITCVPDGNQCKGDGNYGPNAGFLYFVANPDTAFPFMQLNATGLNTAITYTPPKNDSQNKGTPSPSPLANPANLIENLKSLPEVKRTFSIQAVQ